MVGILNEVDSKIWSTVDIHPMITFEKVTNICPVGQQIFCQQHKDTLNNLFALLSLAASDK